MLEGKHCPSRVLSDRWITDMSSFSFVCPNKRTLPRSQRIADKTWELYRADIVREFHSGGGKGYAQASKWIKHKRIPGFDPRFVLNCLFTMI